MLISDHMQAVSEHQETAKQLREDLELFRNWTARDIDAIDKADTDVDACEGLAAIEYRANLFAREARKRMEKMMDFDREVRFNQMMRADFSAPWKSLRWYRAALLISSCLNILLVIVLLLIASAR